MSISSEITALSNNISSAYTAISNKGGTIPANKNTANLANAIASITTGGGGGVDISGFFGASVLATGNFTGAGENTKTITHNLGVVPKLVIYVGANVPAGSNAAPSAQFGVATNSLGSATDMQAAVSDTRDLIGATPKYANATGTSGTAVISATTTEATLKSASTGAFALNSTYYWIALA